MGSLNITVNSQLKYSIAPTFNVLNKKLASRRTTSQSVTSGILTL